MKKWIAALCLWPVAALCHHEKNFEIVGAVYNSTAQRLEVAIKHPGCSGLQEFQYWMSDCLKSNPPQIFVAVTNVVVRNNACDTIDSLDIGTIQRAQLKCAPAVVHVMKNFDGDRPTHKDIIFSVKVN